MNPLARHFLRRALVQRALMAGSAGAVALAASSAESLRSPALAPSIIWMMVLLVAYIGLYPLTESDWSLPRPRRKLFDAVASAYLLAGQLATLPPLLIASSKSPESAWEAIARGLSLQALAALFQVLAASTLPFWRLQVTLGQLVSMILLFGSFAGAAIGLGFASGLLAGLLTPLFLIAALGAWRLGRWLYSRYEPAAGLGFLHAARGLAGGGLASLRLPDSLERERWPDPIGRLPARWRFFTRSVYWTWLYWVPILWAAVGPFAMVLGEYGLVIFALPSGSTVITLLASRLTSLTGLKRAPLHTAAFLPLLGISLLPILGISLMSGLIAVADYPLTLVTPLLFLVGAACSLPSRGAYRRPPILRVGTWYPVLFIVGVLFALIWQITSLGASRELRLEQTRAIHDFLAAHFTIVGPALLAACVLLYFRNQRAFRWLEWRPSPFQRG